MKLEQIKSLLKSDEYSFLKTNEHLNRNIIILTLGGSHAYGTDIETSDLDVRGCALNSKADLLTNHNFEQFVNEDTDTTIYAFNKLISLLSNVNPNTIEMLGNKPEHYLYLHPIGKELIDNAHMFLSKKAIYSFGGYANQQLRRLENKSIRTLEQERQEQHILGTINSLEYIFKEKYAGMPDDACKLYIDKALNPELNEEIFMDINLSHYPLRDYKEFWSELNNIVKSYGKIGQRNFKAMEHGKLSKHMMHLVRLYLMCFDILENEKIVTYREKEHDLLMDIRNGKFLDSEDCPTKEFYEMLSDLEKRLDYDKNNTNLPDAPDYKKIDEFVLDVNERVVRNEI